MHIGVMAGHRLNVVATSCRVKERARRHINFDVPQRADDLVARYPKLVARGEDELACLCVPLSPPDTCITEGRILVCSPLKVHLGSFVGFGDWMT